MKARAVIKGEVDASRYPISDADLMAALHAARVDIESAIARNLPNAYDVNRDVELSVAVAK